MPSPQTGKRHPASGRQASATWGYVAAHAAPPGGGSHVVARRRTPCHGRFGLQMQQTTTLARPQLDAPAKRRSSFRHRSGTWPPAIAAAITPAAHRVYARWLAADSQLHPLRTAWRTAVTAAASVPATSQPAGKAVAPRT